MSLVATRALEVEKLRRFAEGHLSIPGKWLTLGREEIEWDWEGGLKGLKMSLTLFI